MLDRAACDKHSPQELLWQGRKPKGACAHSPGRVLVNTHLQGCATEGGGCMRSFLKAAAHVRALAAQGALVAS